MFKFNKITTIPFDKLLEIRRNEYVTLQLIPTKSNKNNATDGIASLINKMYIKTNKLIKIKNKKLEISIPMKASYYIHITKETVEFYFIVPKCHLSKFKAKFAEIWKSIEVKEVDQLPVNVNDCTKYQLRYKMHDALSLNVDKRNNNLLNANMSVLEILEKEDSVGIFYNFIPTGEKESNYFLAKDYREAIERYRKGDNLKKSKNIIDLGVITLKFLFSFLDDLINSILSNDKNHSNMLLPLNKEISPSTKRKAKSDICKTQMLVLANSKDKDKEKQLAIATCNTFKTIGENEDNELVYKEVKKVINIRKPRIYDIKENNTSIEECSNFISLPGKEIIEQYKNIEHKQTRENPVPQELREGIINLGKVKYKDNKDCAYLSNDKNLQSLPLAIMGGSRSGKTTFSINMCKNIIDAGEGLIVIDFIKNTELAEKIKGITPVDRLIEIDLSNPKHVQSLAYNEIKIKEGMSKDEVLKIARMQANYVLQLVNIINNDDKQLAPKMRKYLGAAARVAFCSPGTSMKDILKILQSHTVRHEFIDKLSNELKMDLEDSIIALEELDDYSKTTKESPISIICGTKDNKIEGIIDRIDLLRENLIIDSMLSKVPKDNVDFVDAMEQGKVILIRMRDIDFDDDISIDILTTLFIQKIWIATKVRGTMHEYPRRCTVLIDEVFQSPTSQKLLTKQFVQSAKFGLKYVLTLHYMDQLSKEAQSALKNSNASYMLISGVDKKAFEALEEEFNVHGYCLDDLLNLKRYHSLNLIKSKDGYESFITHLPPELKNNNTVE